MEGRQFHYWIATGTFDGNSRKLLTTFSRCNSAGEQTPPFVGKELHRLGVVISTNHIQTIN